VTPEGTVKASAEKVLKKIKAYYFMPSSGGYGRKGIPDIVVCYKGRFIGIECKFDAASNPPTKLQQLELAKIKQAGGIAIVFDSNTTQKELTAMLNAEAVSNTDWTDWALEHIS
tara:strand:+ start:300 stop:641 length:342 start_codon:yes stop_codon:yes gene_type:complete